MKKDIPENISLIESVVDSTRKLNEAINQINLTEPELVELQIALDGITKKLNAKDQEPLLSHSYFELAKTRPEYTLPKSPIKGPLNPVAAPINVEFNEQENCILARVNFSKLYEGPPGLVHGGIISAVYDQILALVTVSNGTPGFTGSLNIEYLKPTPTQQPLLFKAWVSNIDGRKVTALGECYFEDETVTKAKGLFIQSK